MPFNIILKGNMKNAAKVILLIPAALLIFFILLILAVRFGAFGSLPGEEELRSYRGATASLVLSEDGRIIGRYFHQNRTNVSYNHLPQHLVEALVATEDARFYRHRGIDARSLARVAVRSLILNDPGSGGGSTISQQLAKNIFGRERHGPLSLPVNKIREALVALRIERIYSKEEILTLYLNTVAFGENVYGIEAASRRYFDKGTGHLTVEESAVLVGMLAANTLYNPRLFPERALKRRNLVISRMEGQGYLQPEKVDSLTSLPLALDYVNLEAANPAGYFLVQVRREAEEILAEINDRTGRSWNLEEDGLVINTTLNHRLQDHAIRSFRQHLPPLQKILRSRYSARAGERILNDIAQREMQRLNLTERASDTIFMRVFDWEGSYNSSITVYDSLLQALTLLHAGMMGMDPLSGAVRMYIGGIDHHTQPFDQVTARRQMASAFKPVLYAAALEKGIRPCKYYDNDSIVVEDYDNWTPVNYSREYGGQYSMAGALSASMNIPTFNLFLEVGYDDVEHLWNEMGFSFPLARTPALALGTAEASIREAAVAYAVLANGGYRVEPYTIISIETPGGDVIYRREQSSAHTRILSGQTAILMNAMLQKAVNEGTGTTMRTAYGVTLPLAGKTGTSQNHADAWFAAYNPSLVIVSRAGSSTRAVHFAEGAHGSGTALALPLVAHTMHAVQQDRMLNKRFAAGFPDLPPALEMMLQCPDYREKGVLDRFLDRFRDDVIIFTEQERSPRRRMWPFSRRRSGR